MSAIQRQRPKPQEIQKLHTLRQMASHDALDPSVVRAAHNQIVPFKPDDWKSQAKEIHRFVRDGIRFQRDPDRKEEFAPSALVLERGWDDCDGKAKLAVAMMRSLGMEADIVPVWDDQGNLAHVQYAVRFPGSGSYPGAQRGGWLKGETTVSTAELGEDPFSVPINPETGRLPLSGGPTTR